MSIYEPDIYSVADNWGYTKDEVERFIWYFEETLR